MSNIAHARQVLSVAPREKSYGVAKRTFDPAFIVYQGESSGNSICEVYDQHHADFIAWAFQNHFEKWSKKQ
jgi:hypothetical protein